MRQPEYLIKYKTMSGHTKFWPEGFREYHEAFARIHQLAWAHYERPEVVKSFELPIMTQEAL